MLSLNNLGSGVWTQADGKPDANAYGLQTSQGRFHAADGTSAAGSMRWLLFVQNRPLFRQRRPSAAPRRAGCSVAHALG